MEDVGLDVGSKPLRKIITFNINRIDKKLAERQGFDDLSPESTTYPKYMSLSPLLATK